MSSFTPGPWRVAPTSDYADADINVDSGLRGTGGYIAACGKRGDDEALANARLIAAAPDLLDAAKDAFRVINALKPLGKYPGAADALDKLSAAIAKAEGRS